MSIDYVRLEFRFLFTYVAAVALRCDRVPVFRSDCNTFLSFHSRRRFEEGPSPPALSGAWLGPESRLLVPHSSEPVQDNGLTRQALPESSFLRV